MPNIQFTTLSGLIPFVSTAPSSAIVTSATQGTSANSPPSDTNDASEPQTSLGNAIPTTKEDDSLHTSILVGQGFSLPISFTLIVLALLGLFILE